MSLQSLASKAQVFESPSNDKSTHVLHTSTPKTHPPVVVLGTGLRPISPNRAVFNAKDYFMPIPQPRLSSPRAKPADKTITNAFSTDLGGVSDDFDLDAAVRKAGDRVASMYGDERVDMKFDAAYPNVARNEDAISSSDIHTSSEQIKSDVFVAPQATVSDEAKLIVPLQVTSETAKDTAAGPIAEHAVVTAVPITENHTESEATKEKDSSDIVNETSVERIVMPSEFTSSPAIPNENVKHVQPPSADITLVTPASDVHTPPASSEKAPLLPANIYNSEHIHDNPAIGASQIIDDSHDDSKSAEEAVSTTKGAFDKPTAERTPEPTPVSISEAINVNDAQLVAKSPEPSSYPAPSHMPALTSSEDGRDEQAATNGEDISQDAHSQQTHEPQLSTAIISESTNHHIPQDHPNPIIPEAEEAVGPSTTNCQTETTTSILSFSIPLAETDSPSQDLDSEQVAESAATIAILPDSINHHIPLDHQTVSTSKAVEAVVPSSTDTQPATIPSIYSSSVLSAETDQVLAHATQNTTLSSVDDRAHEHLKATSNVASKVHDIEIDGSTSLNIPTPFRSPSAAEGEIIDGYHENAEHRLSANAVPMSRSSSMAEAEILNAYATPKEAEVKSLDHQDAISEPYTEVKQETPSQERVSSDVVKTTAVDKLSDASPMLLLHGQGPEENNKEFELSAVESTEHQAANGNTTQPPTVENDIPLAVPATTRRSIDSDLSEKRLSSDAGDERSFASSSNVLSSLSTPSLSQSLNSNVSATSPSEITDAIASPTVTKFTLDPLAKDTQKDLATDVGLDPVVEIPAAEVETIDRETTPTAVKPIPAAAIAAVAKPALALPALSNSSNGVSRRPTPPPKPAALAAASQPLGSPPVRPLSRTPPEDNKPVAVSAERPARSARPVSHAKRAQTMGPPSFPEAGPSAGPSTGPSGPSFSVSHNRSQHMSMRPPVANRFHTAPARHSLVPSLDDIDKLDITGLYGPSGLLHHDGPYDACLTYRNQRPRQAPVLAFAEEEEFAMQEQERLYGRTKSIHHTNVWGANPEEAFEDYAAAARRRRQSRYAGGTGTGSAESSRASSRQPSPEPSPSTSPKLLPVPNKPGKPSPLSQSTTAAAREDGRSLRSRGSERKSSMKRSKSILERFRSMRDKPSVPFNEHHEEATGASLSKKSTIRKLGQTLGLSRRGRQTTVV